MRAVPAANRVEEVGIDGEGWAATEVQGEELSSFLTKGVTKGTRNSYASDWKAWTTYIMGKQGGAAVKDVYLDKVKNEKDKAIMLALFFKARYELGGMRGRQATSVSAGIKHHFAAALKPVDWFDSQIVKNARSACRMSCDELRVHKKEATSKATVPISEDMIAAARARLWEGRSWNWGDIDARMTYVGLMWGFDQVARISEYTSAEVSAEDHCVRLWQLSFIAEVNGDGQQRVIPGSALSAEMKSLPVPIIVACEVEASSHKCGALSKKKVIGRRSSEEGRWLDDLVEWLTTADLAREDQIFTRYKAKVIGGKVYRKRLSAEMVRVAVKDMATASGFPSERFSAHSLRKGGMTQMRGLGASVDDRRDRGNYADGSVVFDTIYDYSTVALGPLACNVNVGVGNTIKPTTQHVGRCLPVR